MFDSSYGTRLSFVEQGNELRVDADRGPGEPSLARFQGRYYLTLRQDKAGLRLHQR